MRGLVSLQNPMGFVAVRLHYTADPAKDPQSDDPVLAESAARWLEVQRLQWPDPNDFEREFEINFDVGLGSRVFPQFTETLHSLPHYDYNKHKVIYRAWDFGWHCPVCLFAQIDRAGRCIAFLEVAGKEQDTHSFASRIVEKCATTFPQHTAGFEDFCDPAGQQQKSIESEKNERRDVEVLEGLGIFPKCEFGWSRKDGRTLVHRLLALRADKTPGLYVAKDGCPQLTQAFLGRYVFPTKQNGRVAEDPDDATHPWADLMATVRYLAIGLHRRLGLARFALSQSMGPASPETDTHGYGTPRWNN